MMLKLVPQDAPRGDIIPIRESSRNAEDLEIREPMRRFQQSVDMPLLGHAARELESVRSLLVAIRAGGSQNDYAWSRHKVSGVGCRYRGGLNAQAFSPLKC
jgi:hypothetical protein